MSATAQVRRGLQAGAIQCRAAPNDDHSHDRQRWHRTASRLAHQRTGRLWTWSCSKYLNTAVTFWLARYSTTPNCTPQVVQCLVNCTAPGLYTNGYSIVYAPYLSSLHIWCSGKWGRIRIFHRHALQKTERACFLLGYFTFKSTLQDGLAVVSLGHYIRAKLLWLTLNWQY